MEFMDFIDDYCKEFHSGNYPYYLRTAHHFTRLHTLWEEGRSDMLTAALWVLDTPELSELEPWIVCWFGRQDSINTQEQEVIKGYEF